MQEARPVVASNGVTVHREPLLELRCMRPERAVHILWSAIYELWRLSWFCAPGTRGREVPQPVSLGAWLEAVHQNSAHREEEDPGSVSMFTPVAAKELAHEAGALLKIGMAGARFDASDGSLLYAIDTEAALQIQSFLNTKVSDQRLRPGLPVFADQATAILAMGRATGGVIRRFRLSPWLAVYHSSWAMRALDKALGQTEDHDRPHKRPPAQDQPAPKRARTQPPKTPPPTAAAAAAASTLRTSEDT